MRNAESRRRNERAVSPARPTAVSPALLSGPAGRRFAAVHRQPRARTPFVHRKPVRSKSKLLRPAIFQLRVSNSFVSLQVTLPGQSHSSCTRFHTVLQSYNEVFVVPMNETAILAAEIAPAPTPLALQLQAIS